MQYYIGIDGGGTKSRFLAVDAQKNILYQSYGKSTNLASNSKQFVKEGIESLLDGFLSASRLHKKECAGFCIGSAGLDSESSEIAMRELIEELGISCSITVVNDSVLALSAATQNSDGIIVISGTGSIACGMAEDGSIVRSGGWGHLLDDGGSAYWIGKEALRRSLMSNDGRDGETILCEYITKALGVRHISDCGDYIYSQFNKVKIAELSVIVYQAGIGGDAVSLSILREAAQELKALAQAVINRLHRDIPSVTACGGTILNNDILFQMFSEAMHADNPHIEIKKLQQESVWGAIQIAMNKNKA